MSKQKQLHTIEKETTSMKKLNFRYLYFSMAMMVARSLLLLLPILMKTMTEKISLFALLSANPLFNLIYILGFFDLLCFVELYYTGKFLRQDASSTAWSILYLVGIAQLLTLNAMSVGMLLMFLSKNRKMSNVRHVFHSLTTRERLYVLLNVLVLGGSIVLIYFLFIKIMRGGV